MNRLASLRLRLIGLFVLVALAVAVAMIVAVQRFSAEQIMHLAMESGLSIAEAEAMFDQYVGNVLLIGAGVGLALGTLAAWWLLRRVLQPLDRLTGATRAIAAGDFAARVAEPPDPELRPLAVAFNQMAATLERVEEFRRQLVEDVAHELRTPLTSLQGYLEAMADGIVEPTPDMLRTVHEEIVRLSRLVEGLDQLARGEAGEQEPSLAEVDLEAIVERAVQIASPDLAARGIRVSIRTETGTASGLPWLLADPGGIGQVVANLMQNATRYTPDGGEVTVRLELDREWVLCSVQNTGADIPADQLPLIWERLHRIDPSRARQTGGSGIGLAIVRQIVQAHGGQVGASSHAGLSTIWFRLPVRVGSASAQVSPG